MVGGWIMVGIPSMVLLGLGSEARESKLWGLGADWAQQVRGEGEGEGRGQRGGEGGRGRGHKSTWW